jgi:hypothetical protein
MSAQQQPDGQKKILELEDVHTFYGSIEASATSLAMSRSGRPGLTGRPSETTGRHAESEPR